MGRRPVYDFERIQAMAAQGMSHRAIASELGCSPTTVNHALTPGAYERHLARAKAWRDRRREKRAALSGGGEDQDAESA